MMDWLVELIGDAVDLQQLAKELREPDASVTEEEGRFYLRSASFDPLTGDVQVRDRAMELVKLVNAIAKLQNPAFEEVRVDHVVEVRPNGSRAHHRTVSAAAALVRIRALPVTVITGDAATPQQQPAHLACGVLLAVHDPAVAAVLQHLGRLVGKEAVNLYKISEILGEDVTGSTNTRDWTRELIARGWATAAEVDSFRSVHDPGVLGDEARHAVHSRPSPAKPWTLAQAEAFIRRVTLDWLRFKGCSG